VIQAGGGDCTVHSKGMQFGDFDECVQPMTFYCGDQEQGVIGYPTDTKHCPYIA
jgi:hypothetical protein